MRLWIVHDDESAKVSECGLYMPTVSECVDVNTAACFTTLGDVIAISLRPSFPIQAALLIRSCHRALSRPMS